MPEMPAPGSGRAAPWARPWRGGGTTSGAKTPTPQPQPAAKPARGNPQNPGNTKNCAAQGVETNVQRHPKKRASAASDREARVRSYDMARQATHEAQKGNAALH